MSLEHASHSGVTPLSVEEFEKKEIPAQSVYLKEAILEKRNIRQEIPWELLYRYCQNDVAGALIEQQFLDTWEPKTEHEIVSALFYRMKNGKESGATMLEFTNFVSWVSTSKDVSDRSKESLLANMVKANFPEEFSVLLCSVLQKQVEYDADDWLRAKTPPTLASLVFLAQMNKQVDADWEIPQIDITVGIAENLSFRSDFFNTVGGVYGMGRNILEHIDVAGFLPSGRPYVRLHVLRRMFDFAAEGIFPENESDVALLMVDEIEQTLRNNNRYADEHKSAIRPTVGVEYQGESDDTIGLSPMENRSKFVAGRDRPYKYGTTKVFRNAFTDIMEFAHFDPSDDFYYEYCFPPSVSPKLQNLMFLEIQKLETHLVGVTSMEMSVQPNFGDVRYKRGEYEELTELQFMLFGAGYGIRQNEFSQHPDDITWGRLNQNGGYKGGAMSYQRDREFDGIHGVNGKRPGVVSEMRMPVAHSFSEAVRFVQYSSDLVMLAKAFQRLKAGTRPLQGEASMAKNWLLLLEKTKHVFQCHGFDFTEVIEVPAWREKFARHVAADLGAIAVLSPTSNNADERADYDKLLVVQMRQLLVEYRREALAAEGEYRQKYIQEIYE